jgi:hypothetical protein
VIKDLLKNYLPSDPNEKINNYFIMCILQILLLEYFHTKNDILAERIKNFFNKDLKFKINFKLKVIDFELYPNLEFNNFIKLIENNIDNNSISHLRMRWQTNSWHQLMEKFEYKSIVIPKEKQFKINRKCLSY